MGYDKIRRDETEEARSEENVSEGKDGSRDRERVIDKVDGISFLYIHMPSSR